MMGEAAMGRKMLAVSGPDRLAFLQGLITNDIGKLEHGLVYAAILTPQGKYLADFLLLEDGARILLDTASSLAPALLQRLNMYRLRAKVEITETDLLPLRGLGTPPDGAHADPRHPALGWRSYEGGTAGPACIDWDAIRVAQCIPESGVELIPDESYILESGFERLNGVDFRKGCYVGQEVTARMKHKTELRKGLATVGIAGAAPIGTEITREGKAAGRLFTQSGSKAIAYLRFDRAGPEMVAGPARLTYPAD